MSGGLRRQPEHVSGAEERVQRAAKAVASGGTVVVTDDADDQSSGCLILAAEHATPQNLAFMVRHTSGFVCVAMLEEDCDRLGLPPMVRKNHDRPTTSFRVTTDAVGSGTGISARDRSRTIARLGSRSSVPTDFTRPGHVVPLAAQAGGVLERSGQTEAAVDLAVLAGRAPAGALCKIVSRERPTAMARGKELSRFAEEHELELLHIADLAAVLGGQSSVRRGPAVSLRTRFGDFCAVGYVGSQDGAEHLALTRGSVKGAAPVYVHLECLVGDALRSQGCSCRRDLDVAMATIDLAGCGAVIYLRPPQAQPGCITAGRTLDDRSAAQTAGILVDLGLRSRVPPLACRTTGWLTEELQPQDWPAPSTCTRTADLSSESQPFVSA